MTGEAAIGDEPTRGLITGAAGNVGTILARGLGDGFALRGFDCVPAPETDDAVDGAIGYYPQDKSTVPEEERT